MFLPNPTRPDSSGMLKKKGFVKLGIQHISG